MVIAVAEGGGSAFTIRASSNFGAAIADVDGAAIVTVDGEVKAMVSLFVGCPDARSAAAGTVVEKHELEVDSVDESKSFDFHAVARSNKSVQRKSICLRSPPDGYGWPPCARKWTCREKTVEEEPPIKNTPCRAPWRVRYTWLLLVGEKG